MTLRTLGRLPRATGLLLLQMRWEHEQEKEAVAQMRQQALV
jgi:hypothetical protein